VDPKVPANDMHRLEAPGGLLVNWWRSHRRCAATGTKLSTRRGSNLTVCCRSAGGPSGAPVDLPPVQAPARKLT